VKAEPFEGMIKPMNSKNMRLGQAVPEGTKSPQTNCLAAFEDGHDAGRTLAGRGGRLKLVHIVGALALASCGGQEIGTGSGGSAGAGGGSGSGGSSGFPNDGGSLLPEVDSSACETEENCVLCDDDKWHCPSVIYSQCPSDVVIGGSCQGYPYANCLECSTDGGPAVAWLCLGVGGSQDWRTPIGTLPWSCAP
jgi:hypothetical protein